MPQRPVHIDLPARMTPPHKTLPSPPESDTKSPFDLNPMSPVSPSRPMASPKERRTSAIPRSRHVEPCDTKSFVLAPDASPSKYMHHFDSLTEKLDVIGPTSGEHQVRQDPTGKLQTWEYQLPQKLWPPVKESARNPDNSLKIRWGKHNGYVQITNIGKALRVPNLKMTEFLRGYDDQIVRIRGGQIEVQGSWIPYELARKVCLEKCHRIRKYLAPLFGPDFVDACVPVKPEDEPTKRRPGRRPKSPPVAVKRAFDDSFDEDEELPPKQHESKRRAVRSCASGLVPPPPLPYNLDMDQYNVNIDEICSMMSAARELMRLQHCPWNGPPMNDWPIPGDPRLGGFIYHQGRRYKWNGADHLQAQPDTPPPTLPPVAPLIHPTIPPTHYTRFPITPSPHQSPPVPSSLEFQSPFSTAAGRTLISPPMSLRESFSGFGRERQYSVVTTDECQTPVREYFGSLFTPQPENERYEDEC